MTNLGPPLSKDKLPKVLQSQQSDSVSGVMHVCTQPMRQPYTRTSLQESSISQARYGIPLLCGLPLLWVYYSDYQEIIQTRSNLLVHGPY